MAKTWRNMSQTELLKLIWDKYAVVGFYLHRGYNHEDKLREVEYIDSLIQSKRAKQKQEAPHDHN